jgi:hypothetical protein
VTGDWEAGAARRGALIAAHGQPVRFTDTAAALWLLNARHLIHPVDAMAFVYRDQAAADAYAKSNADHHDVRSLGTVPCDGGVLGVLDLRPALTRHGMNTADPGLPDRWPLR